MESSVPVTATVSLGEGSATAAAAAASTSTSTTSGAAAASVPDMLPATQEKPVSSDMLDPGKQQSETFLIDILHVTNQTYHYGKSSQMTITFLTFEYRLFCI